MLQVVLGDADTGVLDGEGHVPASISTVTVTLRAA